LAEYSISLCALRAHGQTELFSERLFERQSAPAIVVVSDTTTLAEIVSRAGLLFDIQPREHDVIHVVFDSGHHARTSSLMAAVHADYLTATDDAGAVRWRVPASDWHAISFANLVDSHAAGLIDDPQSVLVIWSGQYGNGFLPIDWEAFFKVVEHTAAILGVLQSVPALANGVRVLKGRFSQWRDRRARPEDILRFILHQSSWDSADLAKRLGIPRAEARSLLTLFGYSYDDKSRLYLQDSHGRTSRVRNEMLSIFEEYEGE
jgi:hypothetical protein